MLYFSLAVIHPSETRYAYSCFLSISATASNKCLSRKGQRPGPSLVQVKNPRNHRTSITLLFWYLMTQILQSVTLSCNPSDQRIWKGRDGWMNARGQLASLFLCSSTPHPSRTFALPIYSWACWHRQFGLLQLMSAMNEASSNYTKSTQGRGSSRALKVFFCPILSLMSLAIPTQ